MDFLASFLLATGVMVTEVTLLIYVMMLISVILDTIMMTAPNLSTFGTLVIATGVNSSETFFIICTELDHLEMLAPLCSSESDSVTNA